MFNFFYIADGVTYSFGVLYTEFLNVFNESKGATAWIASLLVGITLCSGNNYFYLFTHKVDINILNVYENT